MLFEDKIIDPKDKNEDDDIFAEDDEKDLEDKTIKMEEAPKEAAEGDEIFDESEEVKEEAPVEEAPVEEPVVETEAPVEEDNTLEEPEDVPTEEVVAEANPVEEPKKKREPAEKYTEPYPRSEPRMKRPKGANICFFGEKQRPNVIPDHTIYSGDDGLPYVDEDVMLVTDGLGGASGFRHMKFNRGLFEEDLSFEALFGDMYGSPEENEILNNYVIDSFAVVRSLRDLYDKGMTAVFRKSGHMGSRVASSVMLHQLLSPEVKKEVFTTLKVAKIARDDGNKAIEKQNVNKVVDKITNTFREEFLKAAEHAELKMEGANPGGQYLLGTTLCATFVKENENDVDALYLLAGDSLPFLLDEGGLCEVMAANERSDGGMTNCVRANDEELLAKRKVTEPFHFESKFISFKKPCILMNASDGIFDHFTRPYMLEWLILNCLVKANDYQEFSDLMLNFYVNAQTIDDSQTMAAKFFGFSSYDEVKAFAQKRIDELNEKYASELKDFFSVDYEVILGNAINDQKNNASKLFMEINANPAVNEFFTRNALNREEKINTYKGYLETYNKALPQFESELAFHSSIEVPSNDKYKDREQELQKILEFEIESIKRYVEKTNAALLKVESSEFFKTFRDAWNAGMKKAVEILIKGGVYTEDAMAELFNKYSVSYSDDGTEKIQENLAVQQQLEEEYLKGYERLTKE